MFLKLIIFERERERETERNRVWAGRGRERGRYRIQSKLRALSCQHRARHGARTHIPWDHDLSWSWTLNWLNHPHAPVMYNFLKLWFGFISHLFCLFVCFCLFVFATTSLQLHFSFSSLCPGGWVTANNVSWFVHLNTRTKVLLTPVNIEYDTYCDTSRISSWNHSTNQSFIVFGYLMYIPYFIDS